MDNNKILKEIEEKVKNLKPENFFVIKDFYGKEGYQTIMGKYTLKVGPQVILVEYREKSRSPIIVFSAKNDDCYSIYNAFCLIDRKIKIYKEQLLESFLKYF